MIAIKSSEYMAYGCPKCGCVDCKCYEGINGMVAPLECPECEYKFIVVGCDLKMSPLGFKKNGEIKGFLRLDDSPTLDDLIKTKYNKDFNAVVDDEGFIFPLVVKHPRKSIMGHHYVATTSSNTKRGR